MKPHKLEKQVVDLLIPRIQDEYSASYFYQAAHNWCADKGFFKAAAFFKEESGDEIEHAQTIQKYIVDWNVQPTLLQIPAPPTFTSLVDIIEKAYGIEYDLYEKYEDDSMKALALPDPCTFDFLQQFRSIQQKSVAEYSDKLNILEGVEPTKINLLLIEEKLF